MCRLSKNTRKIHEVEVLEEYGSRTHKPIRGELRLQCVDATTQGAYDALEAARGQQWFRDNDEQSIECDRVNM